MDRKVYRLAIALIIVTVGLSVAVAVFASRKNEVDRLNDIEREVHTAVDQMQAGFNEMSKAILTPQNASDISMPFEQAKSQFHEAVVAFDQAIRRNNDNPQIQTEGIVSTAEKYLDEIQTMWLSDPTGLPAIYIALQGLHLEVFSVSQSTANLLGQQSQELNQSLDKSFTYLAIGLGLVILLLSIMVVSVLLSARGQKFRYEHSVQVQGNLRAVIEASLDAVIVFEKNQRVLEFNSSAERILHIDKRNVLGKGLARFLDLSLDQDSPEANPSECILASLEPGRYNAFARRTDGTTLPVEVGVSVTRGGNGQELTVAYLRDLTDQYRREAALEKAKEDAQQGEKAKSRFLAVVSHEMRTPLNGLLAGVELLKSTTELNVRQKWLTDIIQDSGRNALDQVDNVLALTMQDHEDTARNAPNIFNPSTVIGTLVQELENSVGLQGNRISFVDNSSGIPVVTGSEFLFAKILQNFLKNANKFTQDGEITITLDTEPVSDEGKIALRVSVSDTGIGISKEHQERIFQDFEAVDKSYSRSSDGAGLGLSISRRAAEALGGHIGLESEVGKGSTFTFEVSFPHAENSELTNLSENENFVSRPLDILVVEDNKVNRDILCEILQLDGHSVSEAENGKDAVDIANDIHFDVILMDISMPVMDGLEATRQIRQSSRFPETPIVGVTAHALPDQIAEFADAGMNDVVIKPISIGAISKVLAKFVAGKVTMADEYNLESTSSAAASDPTYIDQETYAPLLEILGADAVRGYVQQFLDDYETVLPEVKALHASGKGEEAALTAHKIAGSAAVLGAAGARALLIRFEDASRKGNRDLCDQLLVEIEALKNKIGPILMPK